MRITLGEIGDKAALPAIRECRNAGDRDVKVCAIWAAQRMQKLPGGDHVVYSVCCQPLIEAEPAGEPPDRQSGIVQESRISGMLLNFVEHNVKLGETQDALKMFFGRAPATELDDNEQIGFLDWLLNDYTPRHFRRTIPQEYLARHGEHLTLADRKAVREWTTSYCSLFQVQSVNKGAGVELKDLLLDRNLFIHDVEASNIVARWECLFTRVRVKETGTVFTSRGVRIIADVSGELRDWIAADRQASGLDWLPYLRANSHRIRQHCLDM